MTHLAPATVIDLPALHTAAAAAGLTVLASACWPETDTDAEVKPLAGFIESTFSPLLAQTADRVLSPVIGKSLVLYLTKPTTSVADLQDSRPTVPRGVPGRRGPTTPSQGAAA